MDDDFEVEERCTAAVCTGVVGEARSVGVACRALRKRESRTDAAHWDLVMYEFVDDAQLSNLESLLVQMNPQRCFIVKEAATKGDPKKLRSLLEYMEVAATELPRAQFSGTDLEADLSKLLGMDALAHCGAELSMVLAARSLGALVRGMSLVARDEEHGCHRLQRSDLKQFMRLDAPAIKALNLLPQARDPNRFCSLAGVLDHCVTSRMGSRLLRQWIRQPLLDADALAWRHDAVEAFLQDTVLRAQLRETGLKGMPDLDRICRRLEMAAARGGASVGLEQLFQLYQFAGRVPALRSALDAYDGAHAARIKERFVKGLAALGDDLAGFERMVEQVVDMEAVQQRPPQFLINPKWSPELEELAGRRDEALRAIEDCKQQALSGWGSDLGDLKCEPDKVHTYIFRTKKANERRVRTLPFVVILAAQKNGVHFTTRGPDGLQARAGEYRELQAEYMEQQKALVAKAVSVAATYVPVLEAASSLLAELDVLLSFSHAAANAPNAQYVRPRMAPLGTGAVAVKRARHPCMEHQEEVYFIPNDYSLDRDSKRMAIITGPNMGGKSTYIRQLGTLCVMAQIGAFVPAEEAALPILDAVLARVGAGDAQTRGVSTFMAEMLEASAILNSATENSLVIVDELGRGTSTYDGFGLAWAIARHISTRLRSFCLFATHFHELTALAGEAGAGVTNLHVTAHTTADSITMLYEVRPGVCDRSFGIHVAELAKFPPAVVAHAKRKAAELEECGELSHPDDAPPPGKRKHDLAAYDAEQDSSIRAFVRDFSALPLTAMGRDQARKAIAELASKHGVAAF